MSILKNIGILNNQTLSAQLTTVFMTYSCLHIELDNTDDDIFALPKSVVEYFQT